MNAVSGHKLIGQTGLWECGPDIGIKVRITNVKNAYGNVRYEVESASPDVIMGRRWISSDKVRILSDNWFQAVSANHPKGGR